MDDPTFNINFKDRGESARLLSLGLIEEASRDEGWEGGLFVRYRLTGKGWKAVSDHIF